MLMITIGMRPPAICARTNPTPSSSGMLRSQVTTSGLQLFDELQRLLPVARRAHHLDERTAESICDTTFRT